MITNNIIQFSKNNNSTNIPQEIMGEILRYLSKEDLYKTRFVNKLWLDLCHNLGVVRGYLHEIGKSNILFIYRCSYNTNTIKHLKMDAEKFINEKRIYCPVPNVRYHFSFNQNGFLEVCRTRDTGVRPLLLNNADVQIKIFHSIPPKNGPVIPTVWGPHPSSFEPYINLVFDKKDLLKYQIKTITKAAEQLRIAMKIKNAVKVTSDERSRPAY